MSCYQPSPSQAAQEQRWDEAPVWASVERHSLFCIESEELLAALSRRWAVRCRGSSMYLQDRSAVVSIHVYRQFSLLASHFTLNYTSHIGLMTWHEKSLIEIIPLLRVVSGVPAQNEESVSLQLQTQQSWYQNKAAVCGITQRRKYYTDAVSK